MVGHCSGLCIAAQKLFVVGKLAYAHWDCCSMAATSKPTPGVDLSFQVQASFVMPPAVLHSGTIVFVLWYACHQAVHYRQQQCCCAICCCCHGLPHKAVNFANAPGKISKQSPPLALNDLSECPQSSCKLQALALCQLQSRWIHPCRVCIWEHGSQCKRDPHLFRNTGHGGSHSRVGIHARPAEAL